MGLTKPCSLPIVSSFFSAALHFLESIIDILCFYIEGEVSLWWDPKYLLKEHMHKQEKKEK